MLKFGLSLVCSARFRRLSSLYREPSDPAHGAALTPHSYQALQPDYAQYTALATIALLAQTNSTAASLLQIQPDLAPSASDYYVNKLWFISLVLTLVVALFSILIRQWLVEYVSFTRRHVDNEKVWARRHFTLRNALETWQVKTLLGALPVMLHAALFVFAAGLIRFVDAVDPSTSHLLFVIIAIVAAIYGFFTFAPLVFSTCPTYTPLLGSLTGLFWATFYIVYFALVLPLLAVAILFLSPCLVYHANKLSRWVARATGSFLSGIRSYREQTRQIPLAPEFLLLRSSATHSPTVSGRNVSIDAFGCSDTTDSANLLPRRNAVMKFWVLHARLVSYSKETLLEDEQGLAYTLRAALATDDAGCLRDILDSCFMRWAQVRTYDLHVLAHLARFMRARAKLNAQLLDPLNYMEGQREQLEAQANQFYTETILSMIKWRDSRAEVDGSPLDHATTVFFIQQACKGDSIPSVIRGLAITRFLRINKGTESFRKALERKLRRATKGRAATWAATWAPESQVGTRSDPIIHEDGLLALVRSFVECAHSFELGPDTLDIAGWTFESLIPSEMSQPSPYPLAALEHMLAYFATPDVPSFMASRKFAAQILTSSLNAAPSFFWSEALGNILFGIVSVSAPEPDDGICGLVKATYRFLCGSRGTGHGGPVIESSEAVVDLLKKRQSSDGTTTSLWHKLLRAVVIPADAAHVFVRSALVRLSLDAGAASTGALLDNLLDDSALQTLLANEALRNEFAVHTGVCARDRFGEWWTNTLSPRICSLSDVHWGETPVQALLTTVNTSDPCTECDSRSMQAPSGHPSSPEQGSPTLHQTLPRLGYRPTVLFAPVSDEDRKKDIELLDTGLSP